MQLWAINFSCVKWPSSGSLQEFTQSCLRHDANLRPTAHDLLFHRVLFEVHSLKLLAAHCLINNQCEFYHLRMSSCQDSRSQNIHLLFLMLNLTEQGLFGPEGYELFFFLSADLLPENCVEEKTKSFDPNAVMAEIRHDDRPGVQLKYK